MRRLVVVRHAKAQRVHPRGDHGRALSARGRAQAEALRRWTEPGGALDGVAGTVVVSDAARTLETFELALAGTPVCRRAVVDPSLYNGLRDVSTSDVLAALAAADPGDGDGDLVLVGHNPTVAQVVWDLADDVDAADAALAEGYPLCGVALLEVDRGLAPRRCALRWLRAPATEG